ncbi:MAG: hypothetical protein A2Y86_07345 [Candidatus Aminicenantes bacterium RBG_13_62_12]|nr:MAG: hypothetical protein A2Y86_07345 [Candidatus Aminicenantes bacterium RBG_13_62_12]
MRKLTLSIILVMALAATPALGNSVTFRVGYFFPEAKSDLWQIEFDQMSFAKSNYQSTAFGLDFELFLSKNFSLVAGFDSYHKNKAGYYVDYQGISILGEGTFAVPVAYGGDFDLYHAFRVSITPFQAGLKITPLGRRSSLIPFVTAGMSVILWSVDMEGDMIDFTDEWILTDPVYGDTEAWGLVSILAQESNRLSLGWFCAGGLQYAVGDRITLQAEVKYFYGKGDMTEWFQGFEPFDLSSLFISLGLNYWF